MPRLQKQTISRYLSHRCKRQLYLNLLVERDFNSPTNLYPKRIVRPAIQSTRQQGEEWEAEKIDDVAQAFDIKRLIGEPLRPKNTAQAQQLLLASAMGQVTPSFSKIDLGKALSSAQVDNFIVQGEYEIDTQSQSLFLQRYRLNRLTIAPISLKFSALRPDLIWVRSAGTYTQYIADGQVLDLLPTDTRLQLQIIDIKLTSEPDHSHYAELAYYMLTLSDWLIDNGLDSKFVVVPNGSVWPGSLEDSKLMVLVRQAKAANIQLSLADLNEALSQDLIPVPFEPIAQRLKTFFERDLVEVLTVQASDWTNLSWHIDQSCATCDFLGIDKDVNDPNTHPNYCHVEATRTDRVVRVPFLGRGSKIHLEEEGIDTTDKLRQLLPANTVFADHNQLRAERQILVNRALALTQNMPALPPGRKTIAIPEPWECDLKIFLTLDFDPGSGLTYAFGVRTFWWSPKPVALQQPQATLVAPVPNTPNKEDWVFIVPQRTSNQELLRLLDVLEVIAKAIVKVTDARQQAGYTDEKAIPRVQFYIWDTVQAKHIRRVMGRHMDNLYVQQHFQDLIWRFPPESILPSSEEMKAPVSVVKTVLRQLVGLPIPYDYSLLKTARQYHPATVNPGMFNVSPLFESGLGDQIPFERAHEIWTHKGYRNRTTGAYIPWNDLQIRMQETVKAKVRALDSVVSRLEQDLTKQDRLLLKPMAVNMGRPVRSRGISIDGQLWLNYAKLEAVSRDLEIHAIHAMDVEEREARYHTAVLDERLQGPDEQNALITLNLVNLNAVPTADVRVYRMRPTSAEVKLDADDFLWALAPDYFPGFLDHKLIHLVNKDAQVAAQLTGDPTKVWAPLKTFTQVTILEVDRDQLLIAVLPQNPQFLAAAERLGIIDFRRNVVLDKVFKDFWTGKLERCLRAIGNPAIASPAPQSRKALLQKRP